MKIYIVEDDVYACERFQRFSQNYPEINICGFSGNSKIALKQIENMKPDVIILDLELTAGEGDGLVMIPDILNISADYSPFILITTNNPSQRIHTHARNTGADYVMCKFQNGYSEEFVLKFLLSIKNTILPTINKTLIPPILNENERDKILLSEISNFLCIIGIRPKLKGFEYLKASIFYSLFNDKSPFELIGKQFHCRPQSAQRAMQNAINSAYDGDSEIKYQFNGRIPTVLTFIRFCVSKTKDNHPELFNH